MPLGLDYWDMSRGNGGSRPGALYSGDQRGVVIVVRFPLALLTLFAMVGLTFHQALAVVLLLVIHGIAALHAELSGRAF
jgi:hypothetical protein